MKLVIDIPEEHLKTLRQLSGLGYYHEVIAKGQPLDNTFEEIKAEIAGTEYHFFDGEAMVKVNRVFDIIEKYQMEAVHEP